MRNPIQYSCCLLLLSLSLIPIPGFTQPITSGRIDSLVERVLTTFEVPGIAVGVVKDGRVSHSGGYGVRSLHTMQKADENTLFGIASNSKAFTSAALGILVDEGKIKWDDKVTDYIPEFKLYDPYVTAEFTIRDLLTHRSGLGLGAGDLMIFPDSTDFSTKDIIRNLRYLKPVSGFRSKFDYDNLMYIVAGEILARVSGVSWEEFIETRIMKPLGMNKSASNYYRLGDKSDVVDPHAPVDGNIRIIRRDFSLTADAAGGIYSNITDMCKWISMQMNDGAYDENPPKQLFSKEVHEEMWSVQTSLPVRGQTPYNTHFAGYGLGWFLNDVKGYKQVSHTGGLAGMVTQVSLIPELKLGIIVLTNQQSGAAFTAITNTIKDSYLGVSGIDWVKKLKEAETENKSNAVKITSGILKAVEEQGKAALSDANTGLFTGTYADPWFGSAVIALTNGKLWFESVRSPRLRGEMMAYKGNSFVVKWNDRSMDADAYLLFETDENGKTTGFKMKPISPLTDFSYDFQDLDFTRTGGPE